MLRGRPFLPEMPPAYGVTSLISTVKKVKGLVSEQAFRFNSRKTVKEPRAVASDVSTSEPEVSNY